MRQRVLFRIVTHAFAGLLLFGCGPEASEPWTEKELTKFGAQMSNAGKAFAVADTCIPMIDENDETRTRVVLEISAKRYTQLQAIDTEERVHEMLDFYKKIGGTEEQLQELETAYRDAYEDALTDLTSLEVCAQTVIDFHNTILNARVRQR